MLKFLRFGITRSCEFGGVIWGYRYTAFVIQDPLVIYCLSGLIVLFRNAARSLVGLGPGVPGTPSCQL